MFLGRVLSPNNPPKTRDDGPKYSLLISSLLLHHILINEALTVQIALKNAELKEVCVSASGTSV